MEKLIDQTLRTSGLLQDVFLIILTKGSTQFVVVHCWTILPLPPDACEFMRVFDFEDAYNRKLCIPGSADSVFWLTGTTINPTDAAAAIILLIQKFTQKLPQLDVIVACIRCWTDDSSFISGRFN